VLIKSTAYYSQKTTYYENKLLAGPARNQGGTQEDYESIMKIRKLV
jgi:hypothetical protein